MALGLYVLVGDGLVTDGADEMEGKPVIVGYAVVVGYADLVG